MFALFKFLIQPFQYRLPIARQCLRKLKAQYVIDYSKSNVLRVCLDQVLEAIPDIDIAEYVCQHLDDEDGFVVIVTPYHYAVHDISDEDIEQQLNQRVLELGAREILAPDNTHPIGLHTTEDIEAERNYQRQKESFRRRRPCQYSGNYSYRYLLDL
jgi:hypothetical protein